jgi:hypothetical protein
MKFSLALAASLFLSALVNAQSQTGNSTAPSATPTPAVPPSNSTNINVSAVLSVALIVVNTLS